MMIQYEYFIYRNKLKISQKKLKNKLIELRGRICQICGNNNCYLELEHDIPVYLGGDIIKNSNLNLMCVRCHKNKTQVDKQIIFLFKKLNIIKGITKFKVVSCISIPQLHNLYKTLFQFISFSNKVKDNFWTGNIKTIEYTKNEDIE